MTGTSSPRTISTTLQQVAELARKAPQLEFTTLAHHIDIEFLHEAYRRTRKDGATASMDRRRRSTRSIWK